MLESQYLVTFGFGGACLLASLVLNRYHDESGILALMASGAFGLTALRGDTISVVTDSGTVVEAGSGDVSLLALGFALVALVTFVGSLRDLSTVTTSVVEVDR